MNQYAQNATSNQRAGKNGGNDNINYIILLVTDRGDNTKSDDIHT